MQADHTNGYEGREVLAFHVYTFDPRLPVRPTAPQERIQAAYDLHQWRKTYGVTVSQRVASAEKAKATIWCVTLTAKGEK